MNKYDEIAQWLFEKIMREDNVSQSEVVEEVDMKFGNEYTTFNKDGNVVVHPKVYYSFRKLNKGDIKWVPSSLSWHKITSEEREIDDLLKDEIIIDDFDVDDFLESDLFKTDKTE